MRHYLVTGTVTACVALFCLASSAVAQDSNAAQQQTRNVSTGQQAAGDARTGHALFMKDGCWECHGTVGQGGAAGPRLAPGPLPVEAIEGYVRRPAGQMPPFGEKVLSHQDIVDIHAYLASIIKPPPLEDIPALSQR